MCKTRFGQVGLCYSLGYTVFTLGFTTLPYKGFIVVYTTPHLVGGAVWYTIVKLQVKCKLQVKGFEENEGFTILVVHFVIGYNFNTS